MFFFFSKVDKKKKTDKIRCTIEKNYAANYMLIYVKCLAISFVNAIYIYIYIYIFICIYIYTKIRKPKTRCVRVNIKNII